MRVPFTAILNSKNIHRLAMLLAVLCTLGTLTLLSGAPAATTQLTVVNNSGREIRHLYLSPADNDNWGPDQLNDSSITSGQSVTLNISWDQATVKVVAEDADGCFVSNTVDATGNAAWTITSDATPNCGG